MNSWTKNNLSFIFNIIILILIIALSLTGPVISFIHQYHLIVEEFGKFIGGIFIYDNYAWWNLTVLIWLPYGIYLRIWNKKTDKEMKREMYKLFIDNGENRK